MAYNSWAEGQVLSASDLNENFTLITAVLHSITGGQMADDAINAGQIIANDIVDETHLDYADTVNAVRCLQIGKEAGTHQQLLLKGTGSVVINTTVTITDVTFTYSNADLATGDPGYLLPPHVCATAYTDDAAYVVTIKAVGTQSCVLQCGPGTDNITQAQGIYWMVVGDV